MNQIFLTGRICETEKTVTGRKLKIAVFQYEPDKIEYIPVFTDDTSKVFIRDFRCGSLVSIVGRLIFDKEIKILAEKINFAG